MSDPKTATANGAISYERAVRLSKLLNLLDGATRNREVLIKRLKVDLRSFYRDIKYLRELGIEVEAEEAKYKLEMKTEEARRRLPFPDPGLTIEEAELLTKGRTRAHRKLKQLLQRINGTQS